MPYGGEIATTTILNARAENSAIFSTARLGSGGHLHARNIADKVGHQGGALCSIDPPEDPGILGSTGDGGRSLRAHHLLMKTICCIVVRHGRLDMASLAAMKGAPPRVVAALLPGYAIPDGPIRRGPKCPQLALFREAFAKRFVWALASCRPFPVPLLGVADKRFQ